jgi:hypothetical protein
LTCASFFSWTTRSVKSSGQQGCQMVFCRTKNPNLGKFWRAREWNMLAHFNRHLEHFVAFGMLFPFWYVAPRQIWQPWRRGEWQDHPTSAWWSSR